MIRGVEVAGEVRAYRVQDEWGDGHACVVFSRSNVAARRLGASELDEEFGKVSCRRAPQFDGYTPGPVPASALLADGWWYTCALPSCHKHAYAEEDGTIHFDPARPDEVYCCAKHLIEAHEAAQQERAL